MLHYWKKKPIIGYDKIQVMILLAVARLEIASKWKGKVAPSLSSWRNKLWEHYFILKVTDSIQASSNESTTSNFVELWYPVVKYLLSIGVLPKTYKELDLQIY